MKVTYEFDEDDHWQRRIFERGSDFYMALGAIHEHIRSCQKYETFTAEETLDRIQTEIVESGYWQAGE